MTAVSNLPEIKISYSLGVPQKDRIKIYGTEELVSVLYSIRENDLIEYRESFYLLLLDNSLHLLWYKQVSTGGIASTQVDIRQLLGIALKANACGIILAHNHPSWNTKPSNQDIQLTKRIKEACKLLELRLFDHLILTSWWGYYSILKDWTL